MRLGRAVAVLFALGVLAACTPTPRTGFGYGELPSAPIPVSPADAAGRVTAIRAEDGLGPVRVSPALNALAQRQADVMATTGVLSHTVDGLLTDRLIAAGYAYWAVGENLGAGYRSIEEAFYFWYLSDDHRANLLMDDVTEIGIATAFNPDTPYHSYWALILARPWSDGPYLGEPLQ